MSVPWSTLRIGLVVLAGAGAVAMLVPKLGQDRWNEANSRTVEAVFADASGIGPRSRVQIAGIEIGTVDSVTLTPDARARIVLRIDKQVVLHDDARLTKRSISLLGDFVLDVFPGTSDSPALPPGASIERVVGQRGMEDVFVALADVTRDIQTVTQRLKGMLDSDESGSVRSAIRSMETVANTLNNTVEGTGGQLNRILGDVAAVTASLREVSRQEQGNVHEIVGNVRAFTEQANRVATSLEHVLGSGEGELRDSVASLRHTLDDLSRTLDAARGTIQHADGAVVEAQGALSEVRATASEVRGVVAGVARGEGTLGKLIRDDSVARKIDSTLGQMNQLLEPVAQLQTHVQLRQELHWRPGSTGVQGKTGVQLQLIPRQGKYYGIEAVNEPRGVVDRQRIARSVESSTGGQSATDAEDVLTTQDNALRVSAWIGRRSGFLGIRGGLIEGTGGVGADAWFAGDKLRLSVDAFEWSHPLAAAPRLRAVATLRPAEYFWIGAGIDDALNSPRWQSGRLQTGRDGYVSAGLQFSDDDLKSILTVVGMPSTR